MSNKETSLSKDHKKNLNILQSYLDSLKDKTPSFPQEDKDQLTKEVLEHFEVN